MKLFNLSEFSANLSPGVRLLGLDPGSKRIGVALSDEFQIHPEQSTSALIVHHPKAKYFSV